MMTIDESEPDVLTAFRLGLQVADATKDFPAVRLVMGHVDNSISATYRERIDDDRLQTVVEHVRGWLFPADDSQLRQVG